MIIMNLKQLQNLCRSDWDTYIAKHFTKQTCEDCGSKESLHLHHVRTFKEIFDFGCNLFSFNDETTISQETEQIFRSWMLGEQLKSPMKTLCSDCHLKAHGKTKKENKKLAKTRLRDKLFLAFLCNSAPKRDFYLTTSQLLNFVSTAPARKDRERMNILTNAPQKKHSYHEYQKMIGDIDFSLIDSSELLSSYVNYPKQFGYIIEIYYALKTKGDMHQKKLFNTVEFASKTFLNQDIDSVVAECGLFNVEYITNEYNVTYKVYSLVNK